MFFQSCVCYKKTLLNTYNLDSDRHKGSIFLFMNKKIIQCNEHFPGGFNCRCTNWKADLVSHVFIDLFIYLFISAGAFAFPVTDGNCVWPAGTSSSAHTKEERLFFSYWNVNLPTCSPICIPLNVNSSGGEVLVVFRGLCVLWHWFWMTKVSTHTHTHTHTSASSSRLRNATSSF